MRRLSKKRIASLIRRPMMFKRVKRKIKRKPGKTGHMYFSDDTQTAIIGFQDENDTKKQHEIYLKQIHPAFDSLVENLILVYGFSNPGESIEELKSDCISFLYSSMHKWSPDKGTKAFSYFNVVAKNFLICNSRKSIKRTKRYLSMDHPELLSIEQCEEVESYAIALAPDDVLIEKNRRGEIRDILTEIEKRVVSEHEVACIKAIISIFEKIDDLDFLNKRALRIYVRDISGLTSKKLSIAMTSIRAHYKVISQSTSEIF